MAVTERYQGWVRNFRETWGFLNADGFQGDLFVGLKSNPHLTVLQKDDIVEFEVRRDDKGKPEAVNVVVTGSKASPGALPSTKTASKPMKNSATLDAPSTRAEVQHLIGHTLFGRIKKFKDQWGFINSDSFVGDLFIHTKSNPEVGPLGQGDPVSFEVAQDATASGGFHAVNVAVLKEDVASLVGQTVHGWVKSFKGDWGLLNSKRFDGDIFVGLKGNKHLPVGSLVQGTHVEFEIAPDEKGTRGLQAMKVKLIAGGAPTSMALPGLLASALGGMPTMGFDPALLMSMGLGGGLGLSGLVGQRMVGQVRNFDGNWGFATSTRFQGDIFVGLKSNAHLTTLNKGDHIEFTVSRSSANKSQTGFEAVQVQVIGSGPVLGGTAVGGVGRSRSPPRVRKTGWDSVRSPLAMIGAQLTGVVRSFKGDWGFVNSSAFDGDLFVGTKSNTHLQRELVANDQVMFKVSAGSGGKAEAVEVQLVAFHTA